MKIRLKIVPVFCIYGIVDDAKKLEQNFLLPVHIRRSPVKIIGG